MSATTKSGYLTVPQVAETLGLHVESVRRMIRQRRIPAFKAGRSWRFDPRELDAWCVQQRKAAQGLSVLVVDDEKSIRVTVSLSLQEAGYRVRTASGGVEALEALSSAVPDLLILDLAMPDVSGVEVLKALNGMAPDVPVIILTGYPDGNLMHQALQCSPLTVVAKPAPPHELLKTVKRSLSNDPPSPFGLRRASQ